MKKYLLIILLFLTVIITADTGRVNVLGPNWAVKDVSNIFERPSEITQYSNRTTIEYDILNPYVDYFGGMHFTVRDIMHIGVYLYRPYSGNAFTVLEEPPDADTWLFLSSVTPYTANNQFDLIFALDLDTFIIGFRVSYGRLFDSGSLENATLPDPDDGDSTMVLTNELNSWDFVFDITLNEFGFFDSLNLAVYYGKPYFFTRWKEVEYQDPGFETLLFRLWGEDLRTLEFRGIAEIDDTAFFASYSSDDLPHYNDVAYFEDSGFSVSEVEETIQKVKNVRFGISNSVNCCSGTLRSGAIIDYRYHTWETLDMNTLETRNVYEGYSWYENVFRIPVFLSGEWEICNWLDIRAGLGGDLFYNRWVRIEDRQYDSGEIDPESENIQNNTDSLEFFSNGYAFVGTSLHAGYFSFDLTLMTPVITNNYLLTGVPLGVSPVAYATITYFFLKK
ncbi:hypothetical protein KAU32_12435 [bacterium]|nr:hypothetical protein [bacterium]